MGCNASQAAQAGHLSKAEARHRKPAVGTLLGRQLGTSRVSSFYFVQHMRKRVDMNQKDFWASTIAFWKDPEVFNKATNRQKDLGLRAHNFFVIDGHMAYSTWEITGGAGGDAGVLQHYLDSDICGEMHNMLIRMDWKPDTKFKGATKPVSGWINPAASETKESFFFVKHTMYSNERRWTKNYGDGNRERKVRLEELGLRNHKFNMEDRDFVYSLWEGKGRVKADDLQHYLDTEMSYGHMGSEVFQVYGMKDLHPFAGW